MDILTKSQRTKNMQAIRSHGTKAEKKLAISIWNKGYRYRKNNNTVFGKPDITFKKLKIAVFVDSEYFHGRNWQTNKYRIKTNRKFWWKKIEANMVRDRLVTKTLKKEGWKVLRYWDTEVNKKLGHCIAEIEQTIKERENAS